MKIKKRNLSVPAGLALASVALAVLLGLGGIGCDQESNSANSFPATPAPAGVDSEGATPGPLAGLTVEEIDARVSLNPDQRGPMEEAVAKLRAAHRQRAGRRDRPGRGSWDRPAGGPPMVAFLEDASEILTGEQFVKLAEMLRERLDRWVEQRGAAGLPGWGGPHDRGPGGGFLRNGKWMAEFLDLSDEQREAAREIFRSSFEEVLAVREQLRSGSIDREQAREQIREIRLGTREQLRSILTEEQWEKAEAFRQERIAERIDRRIERMEPQLERRAAFLERVLDLTSEQAGQVTEILVGSIPERTEILNQVKAGTLEPEEAFAQIMELEEGIGEEIAAVLTPEQLEIWVALRDLLPRHNR